MLSVLMTVLAVRSERGQLMPNTAAMINSDLRYALIIHRWCFGVDFETEAVKVKVLTQDSCDCCTIVVYYRWV